MDKSKLNFIISALMFLCLTAMAGLGFLMKFVLVPGRKAMVQFGRPVELTYLGWDRHDWGDLHSYLAFALLGLLALHLILHWKKLLGLYARLIPSPRMRTRLAFALLGLLAFHLILHWKKLRGLFERLIPNPRMRIRVAFGFLIICVLLAYFPFLVTPRVEDKGGRGRRQRSEMEAGKVMVAKAPGEFKSRLGSSPSSCSQKFRWQTNIM